MSKVIISIPYNVKNDVKQEIYEELKRQWDSGILILPSGATATLYKDEDVIGIIFKEDSTNG